MNPAALLALISNLYEQLSAADQRVAELEAKLAESNGKRSDRTVAEGVKPGG